MLIRIQLPRLRYVFKQNFAAKYGENYAKQNKGRKRAPSQTMAFAL